ncbi:hypothetical protein F5Y18DRAFT_236750 [Xylariaceae sp. FL1019]|nr:hypothetical protein F5Y18DRAFT_236750 [Xylariaceae sp. FL1019]
MPPLTNEKRRPQDARQPSQLLNTRLDILRTLPGSNGAVDNGIELGENSSPKADRAVVYFALGRREHDGSNNNDDGRSGNNDNNNSRSNSGNQSNGGRPKSNRKDGGGGQGSGNNMNNKFHSQSEGKDKSNDNGENDDGQRNGGSENNNGGSSGRNRGGPNHGGDNHGASSSLNTETGTSGIDSTTTTSTSTASITSITSTGSDIVIGTPTFSSVAKGAGPSTLTTAVSIPPGISVVQPAVPTMTPGPVMTTTPDIPSLTSSTTSNAQSSVSLATVITPIPESGTATSPLSQTTSAHKGGNRGGDHQKQGNSDQRDSMAMNPVVAKVLMTVGIIGKIFMIQDNYDMSSLNSVGGLVILGLVGWLVYKRFIKPRGSNIVRRTQWFSRNDSAAQTTTNGSNRFGGGSMEKAELPPSYNTENLNSMGQAGYYASTKSNPYGPGDVVYQAPSTLPAATFQKSQPASTSQRRMVPGPSNMDYASLGATLRSVSPYTVSELSRQASGATEVAQRQAYRVSELSSISSGFGDGDIVIPPPLAKTQAIQPPAANQSRFSWMSRAEERRDTVYTTVSEDRPSRHRSVNGWVDQQTGRVKRAFSRAKERGEVPIIPAIPGGQMNVTQQTAYR